MLNILQLMIFILISAKMGTFSQTTELYDEQYKIQQEFMEMIGDSNIDIVEEGVGFILSLKRNQTSESLPPMTLSHYCLLQTIWALASGHVELAETYLNKTVVCYDTASEEWLENFQFEPMLVYDLVKSTSNKNEANEILKQIAVFLSRKYNVFKKAAERADDPLIIWLKKMGLDLSTNGNEAVASAWVKDHIDTVNLLLEMGALGNNSASGVVNISNSNGETLLHFAASRGLKKIAKKLLDNGAAVDQKDVKSLTPLYHAVRSNEEEMALFLLQRGADLLTRTKSGNTLLHLAVIENSSVALSGLLRFGLEIQIENYQKIPPLFLAVELGYNSLIELLYQSGAYIDSYTSSGNTLLHVAVNRGSLVAARNLIKHGASIDLKNSEELTPLYLAAKVGNPDLIWFLLNKGASRHESGSGDSLLHIAARRGDTAAIESLVNLCIPVDELNQKGVTPLYAAAAAGNRAAMELLLAKGADLYITLRNGQRLLQVAAVEGNVAAIESLLNVGLYVDVKDSDMLTELCRAVQNDNIASAAMLIERGANASFTTSVGDTLLHIAAVSGSYGSIHLLVQHGLDIDAENDQNETPLYLAAKNANLKTANLLITLGANRNYVTSRGGTLAHLAAEKNDIPALKTLFTIGADFNAINTDGYTPLYTAIRKSEMAAANIMLETGVDLFYIDLHNDSLLHLAAKNKDHNAIDFLINKGVYIDTRGSNGYRPVDVALYNGNCDTAEYFMKKGANIRGRNLMNRTVLHSAVIGGCRWFLKKMSTRIDNIDPKDKNMQTPLHLAAVLGRKEISETLILFGADVNSVDNNNCTPFQIAAVNRNWDMVSSFLKKDVNLNWTDDRNRSLLHLAILENKEDVLKYLTKQMRVDIFVQDMDGRIPLHLAAEKGVFAQIMSYLIDERVPKSINYRDYKGKTPLHLAAVGGHESTVEYLLSKGADLEATDHNHETALSYAAKHHYWEIARRLLDEICMVSRTNSTDRQGNTVLHLAVLDNKLTIISGYKICLQKNIYYKDSQGRIPLHLAAEKGLSAQFMSYLIDVPESIDFQDYEGKTPLHLAAIGGHESAVEYLLEKGADPLVIDRHRLTPLIYAAKLHHWRTARLLLNKVCMLSDINAVDEENRTVLHLAVLDGQLDVISSNKLCLKKHINSKDSTEKTPLDLSLAKGRQYIVEYFFENYRSALNLKNCTALTLAKIGSWDIIGSIPSNGMGSECRDEKNRTLLQLAAWHGDNITVLSLLQNRMNDVDAMDPDNRTALHLAAMKNRHVVVRILLKHGARQDIHDKDDMTPLTIALSNNSWDTVRELLNNETYIRWTDVYNRTILHYAVINGQKEIIEYLLENTKIDINAKDANLNTPLQLVVGQRNLSSHDRQEILERFVRHGAEWNILDEQKRNILHLVAISGDKETLKYILDRYRLDINGQDIDLRTPLHMAIINDHHGYNNMVGTLLEYGADKNVLDTNQRTPLIYAIENSHYDAKDLLDKFTDLDWSDADNRSIVHLAAMHGCSEVVRKFLKLDLKKVNIDRLDVNEQTPLHLAAREDHYEIVDLLLQERANGSHLDKESRSPLNLAVINNSWKAVEVLVRRGYYKEHRYSGNRTLLHLATMNGLRHIIDYIINYEIVDLAATDDRGDTPLHIAAHKNDTTTVQQLLKKRVNRDVSNGIGQNPLTVAMVYGSWEAVSVLLKGNCDVEAVDGRNRTLLHYAALNRKKAIIDHLLSCRNVDINALDIEHETPLDLFVKTKAMNLIYDYSDINWRDGNGRTLHHLALLKQNDWCSWCRNVNFGVVDAVDNDRQTALHIASTENDVSTVSSLLYQGAGVSTVDINGHTPLHLAARYGHYSVIEKFLNDYGRINHRDLLGRTPLQLSLNNGHQETTTLLKKWGATI
ncbi:unnamed protein product [Nezara viridula]|uniref:Uncharacterized protein n=1 Tax=Nezara viridula TaxID=85310 RepID=A0A9P0H8J0_NEZVI|nr:unnamed protein product [Nezara viridula]